MEREYHFIPLKVLDGTEVNNGIFFFRVIGIAIFTMVGAASGTFAATLCVRIRCKGREAEFMVGRRRGRSR